MKYKILNTIGDDFAIAAKDTLNKKAKVDYKIPTQSELLEMIHQYDAVIIGLGLNFDKLVLRAANKLKAVATATTGLDHIDVDFAKEAGIEILSLKNETEFLNNITGTAELAAGLMIDLMRGISAGFESVKNYQWDRDRFCGHNLAGKTLGVLGYGRLGKMMIKYGQAFGMKVFVCDPHVDTGELENLKFDEFLSKCDVISIHVHLNDETAGLFGKSAFEKMKQGAFLVNTARGKIVSEGDLIKALKDKKIGGYATDVLDGELNFAKDFSNHPLVEYAKKNSNCIIVPHIGGMTFESREATDVFIAEKLIDWIKNN